MPTLFVQASQNRIYQDIVEQIQSAIFDGSMRPGEKLPPERELVEVFKTSRPTLREALRTLEQKGLIEIRLGVKGGAYVRTPNSELMAENLGVLVRNQLYVVFLCPPDACVKHRIEENPGHFD